MHGQESNSEWGRLQEKWRRESAARARQQRLEADGLARHRRELETGPKHWEPVEDEPMPDYEAGDAP